MDQTGNMISVLVLASGKEGRQDEEEQRSQSSGARVPE
jgi:hypothetical protein